MRCAPRAALALLIFLAAGLPALGAPVPFAVEPLDAATCARLRETGVLSAQAPVRCDQLATVRFLHADFKGSTRTGNITVMAAAADHVLRIFQALYERRFPIAQARSMEHYAGDDAASMRDNNTSGFNDRAVTGGGPPSLHAYGLAIDLNPVQNPYLRIDAQGRAAFDPPAGSDYGNRREPRPGKSARLGMAEQVVPLFARHGFTVWGGDWDNPIDYQHFQVPRALAQALAGLPVDAARARYQAHVDAIQRCLQERTTQETASALVYCTAQEVH